MLIKLFSNYTLYHSLMQKIKTTPNTACNQNAQYWYFQSAIYKYQNAKTPAEKAKQFAIIQYYLNGQGSRINY